MFNLYIRNNFGSSVVDLSSVYFKISSYLILCCLSGSIILYFTKPQVRKEFQRRSKLGSSGGAEYGIKITKHFRGDGTKNRKTAKNGDRFIFPRCNNLKTR
jgi:hypothetical protein